VSETNPVPAPDPEAPVPAGWFDRLEDWAKGRITPDIAEVKADTAKVLAHLEALGPNLTSLANVVVTLAKAVDPAAGPVVAEAVAEAERVAADLESLAGRLTNAG
jgi:hypothetical protein